MPALLARANWPMRAPGPGSSYPAPTPTLHLIRALPAQADAPGAAPGRAAGMTRLRKGNNRLPGEFWLG